MKHRLITVPKDKQAEQALNYDNATEEQLIELILNDDEFTFLYKNGLFKLINKVGDTNIDDFEDECIAEKENIVQVIKALKLKELSLDGILKQLVVKIRSLFEEALNRGTGIYFYF